MNLTNCETTWLSYSGQIPLVNQNFCGGWGWGSGELVPVSYTYYHEFFFNILLRMWKAAAILDGSAFYLIFWLCNSIVSTMGEGDLNPSSLHKEEQAMPLSYDAPETNTISLEAWWNFSFFFLKQMAYTVLTHAVLSSIWWTYWMISFLFPANYIKPLFRLCLLW